MRQSRIIATIFIGSTIFLTGERQRFLYSCDACGIGSNGIFGLDTKRRQPSGPAPHTRHPSKLLKLDSTTASESFGISDNETLKALNCAHDMWTSKRNYFLNSKLDWTPKYSEAEVGIKLFANRLPGIGGILKGTWTDFVVHEVRLRDGGVVTLSGCPTASQSLSNSTSNSSKTPWLRFVLCKMGIDTITAIRTIAANCHLPYQAVNPISTDFEVVGIYTTCSTVYAAPGHCQHRSIIGGLISIVICAVQIRRHKR